jgi:hypothetical protein
MVNVQRCKERQRTDHTHAGLTTLLARQSGSFVTEETCTWSALDARVRTAHAACNGAFLAHFAEFRRAVREQLMARNARLWKVFSDYKSALCEHSSSEAVDNEYVATLLAEYNGYRTFWNETCVSEGMEQALLETF